MPVLTMMATSIKSESLKSEYRHRQQRCESGPIAEVEHLHHRISIRSRRRTRSRRSIMRRTCIALASSPSHLDHQVTLGSNELSQRRLESSGVGT